VRTQHRHDQPTFVNHSMAISNSFTPRTVTISTLSAD
jgi:hypothetical protein